MGLLNIIKIGLISYIVMYCVILIVMLLLTLPKFYRVHKRYKRRLRNIYFKLCILQILGITAYLALLTVTGLLQAAFILKVLRWFCELAALAFEKMEKLLDTSLLQVFNPIISILQIDKLEETKQHIHKIRNKRFNRFSQSRLNEEILNHDQKY